MGRPRSEKPHRGRRPTKAELHVARAAIWPAGSACPLCGRVMHPGPSLNEHHLVPRSYGGTERHVMHRFCHNKLHSVFTESELAHVYNTFEKLREHPAIRSFIKWVRKQDPERVLKHRRPKRLSSSF